MAPHKEHHGTVHGEEALARKTVRSLKELAERFHLTETKGRNQEIKLFTKRKKSAMAAATTYVVTLHYPLAIVIK